MKTLIIAMAVVAAVVFGSHIVRSTESKQEQAVKEQPHMTETAVFAGGCFWCTESDFEKVDGVIDAISGYTGGTVANPSYEQVSAGKTGHVEAVKVIYDPDKVSYARLLEVFWRHVDPTDRGGQFVDRGSQYRSVIFYSGEKQRELAEASKKELEQSGRFARPIVTGSSTERRRPRLVVPRHDLAGRVHTDSLIDDIGRPVVLPRHFVLPRQLHPHGSPDGAGQECGIVGHRVGAVDPVAARAPHEDDPDAVDRQTQQQGDTASGWISRLRSRPHGGFAGCHVGHGAGGADRSVHLIRVQISSSDHPGRARQRVLHVA